MTIAVPTAKLTQIHEELSNWDNRSSCSRTELQSLIGLLSYVSNCVRPGRLFISRMLSTLRTFSAKHSRTRIDAEFRKDLLWWKTFLQDNNGVSIIHTQPWFPPDTVVCLSGCGGVSVTQFFHSPFPQHIINMGLSINALELLAVVVALKLWFHTWCGLCLQITSDNTTTVALINSHRTHSDFELSSLREIAYFQARFEFNLWAVHIPGRSNVADAPSSSHLSGIYKSRVEELESNFGISEVVVPQETFQFIHPW
ncbi:uncharacterized protein LOC144352590 [Saccoglossus kowalevskii]